MSNLRTDYKDDVFTGKRKYSMTTNPDETVSFTDETDYAQTGDTYGAAQINELNDIVNNLDEYDYKTNAATESSIADNDYFPFFDTSANGVRKTLWSTLKNLLTQTFAIKIHSSNSAGTYGAGTSTQFGHVKVSDNFTTSAGAASSSIAASSQAVYNVYNEYKGELTANNKRIYMDYKDGKYGINTSANRGADTFIPFRDSEAYLATLPTFFSSSRVDVNYGGIVEWMSISGGGGSLSFTLYCDGKVTYTAEHASISISGRTPVGNTIRFYEGDRVTLSAGGSGEGGSLRLQWSTV